MWTETAQQQHRRDRLRYASDVTDEEWAVIEGFLPRPRKLGRPRTTEMREVVNALLYMLTTGCQWRLLPKEFPPFSTVQRFFYRWRDGELWQKINHSLVLHAREASGREASPTAGIIDSQSRPPRPPVLAVTTPARKSRAVKRHVLTDTNGLLVAAVVHEADTQDRDGAPLVLAKVRYLHRWLRHVFADGAYSGTKLDTTLDKIGHWTIEIIKRSDTVRGFVVLAALGCRAYSRLRRKVARRSLRTRPGGEIPSCFRLPKCDILEPCSISRRSRSVSSAVIRSLRPLSLTLENLRILRLCCTQTRTSSSTAGCISARSGR